LVRSFIVIIFVLILSTMSYAFGGPAPQGNDQTFYENTDPQSTQPSQQVQQTPPASQPVVQPTQDDMRVDEVEKARSEIKQERAELTKIEKYLWNLDSKMIEVRKARNSKKLLELKEVEQATVERARLIKADIAKKMQKYPELKVAEDIESGKVQVKPALRPDGAPAVVEQTPIVSDISVAPAPVVSGVYVYHEVELGDTLFGISRKYYGTPGFYREIAKLNGIRDTSGLKQGMLLKIDTRLKNLVQQKPVAVPAPVVNPEPLF
jgi:nucleoid-associated protein YgaU